MSKKIILIIVLLSCLMLFVSGCDGSSTKQNAVSQACTEVANVLGIDASEISGSAEKITENTNENHYMIALMILSQADMDNSLESYDNVYLVEVNVPNIESGMVVVVEKDGIQTTIVPQGFIDRLTVTE